MSAIKIGTVVSSLYGNKDAIPPRPNVPADVDCILVTDLEEDAPGWRKVFQPRSHLHPRMAAKHAKCLPWEYANSDTVLWMDASCRLISPLTYSWLCDAINRANNEGCELVQFNHPWRQDILEEAHASFPMLKYQGQPVIEQAQHYMDDGHPSQWGLWATGLIIWHSDGLMCKEHLSNFGRQWLAEQTRWTYQDQISHPYLVRKNRINIHCLPGPLHGSGMVEWINHRSEA